MNQFCQLKRHYWACVLAVVFLTIIILAYQLVFTMSPNKLHFVTESPYASSDSLTQPNIAIVTVAFYDKIDMNFYNNHLQYAKLHNYDYYCLKHPFEKSDKRFRTKRKYWKPILINSLLHFDKINWHKDEPMNRKTWEKRYQNYEYVFWIDFDAYFNNFDIKIEDIIQQTYEIYNLLAKRNIITSNSNEQASNLTTNITNNVFDFDLIITGDFASCANAGVTLWKRSEISKKILETWIEFLVMDKTSPREQHGLIATLMNIDFKRIKGEKYESQSVTLHGLLWYDKGPLHYCTEAGVETSLYWKKLLKMRSKLVNKVYSNHVAMLPLYYMNSLSKVFRYDDFIHHLAGPRNHKSIWRYYYVDRNNISQKLVQNYSNRTLIKHLLQEAQIAMIQEQNLTDLVAKQKINMRLKAQKENEQFISQLKNLSYHFDISFR